MLAGLVLGVLVLSGTRGLREFRRFARRTRWLLLSLVLIYGFVTPGEALVSTWGLYSPTREGLHSGASQALRLVVLLAALSWLLSANGRDRLLCGLYVLLKPFALLGLNAERVASRLWLTLHYSEILEKRRLEDWWREAGLALEEHSVENVVLERYAAGWRDGLALLLAVTGLVLAGVGA
jgi:energy-coupling factor transport system permease protein